ncbi:hypothetical protein CJJ07_000586 [Candidozyma auris]|nr:hypothetical protein CJJ07_000586 [[Candida] auris]QEL60596.1 hypothetical protein CJJ09_002709 [[Candida] auris]
MSSSKDFVLEITSVDSKNLATYIVHRKPSRFLKYLRAPIVALLCGILASLLLRLGEEADLIFDYLNIDIPFTEILLANIEGWTRDLPITQMLTEETLRNICLSGSITFLSLVIIAMISLQEPQDSMMIMKDMGIQLNSTDRWGFTNKEFIPMTDIIDIVIHEGFFGYGQVIFYMCVLTQPRRKSGLGNSGIKIVFPNFLPRKSILVDVCRQSREMLYGTTHRYMDDVKT